MPKVSVVLVTYRRMEHLSEILTAWLAETPDVWLCDCSDLGAQGIPAGVKIVRFSPDPGNKARHAVALLTDGDYVIKADDDVLPKPGLINDFLANAKLGGILGLMGRTFQGDLYYGRTTPYRAREIEQPKRVDMVGILTFTPRAYLAFDLKGCATSIEDLFWHMKAFPKVPKFVIPTDKYLQLSESNDAQCLFRNLEARTEREKFYREWYRRNYAHDTR